MPKVVRSLILFFIFFSFSPFLLGTNKFSIIDSQFYEVVQAQELDSPQGLGIAKQLPVTGDNLLEGSIVSYRDSNYQLSSEAYDKSMFGVVSQNPAMEISFEQATDAQLTPVISEGIVPVRVSLINGPIKKGDQITSSDIAGVGMKAEKSGFILGIAQENSPEILNSGESTAEQDVAKLNSEQVVTILVALDVKFAFSQGTPASKTIIKRLLDVVNLSAIAVFEEPKEIFRHVVAALVVLVALGFSFFSFAKLARGGVDAFARNPLAHKTISFGIIVNVLLSILILLTGLAAAYFIISL
ncbi:MAG: hypothetical protein PVJ09_00105 [Candidatus Woesebacteria bacterium]|jgi:hypothetical protein